MWTMNSNGKLQIRIEHVNKMFPGNIFFLYQHNIYSIIKFDLLNYIYVQTLTALNSRLRLEKDSGVD